MKFFAFLSLRFLVMSRRWEFHFYFLFPYAYISLISISYYFVRCYTSLYMGTLKVSGAVFIAL